MAADLLLEDVEPVIPEKGKGSPTMGEVGHSRKLPVSMFRSRFKYGVLTVASHGFVFRLALLFRNSALLAQFHGRCPSGVVPDERYLALFSPLSSGLRSRVDTPPRDYWENTLYTGAPSDESEVAWNDLLHPHGIRLSSKEAVQLNITESVSLSNGDFATIPGFNHNLHCLRRIRQTLFADHYYPNATESKRQQNMEHTVHCLEALRTSIMCQPDLTILPYFHSGNADHDLTPRPNVVRQCVDWDILHSSTGLRKYDRAQVLR
ncbi:hypothetical protein MMC13_006009 [Lambiella insularis]|nr:hypothetical protein [Lambiella insularis]